MTNFRLFYVVDDFGTLIRVLRIPYGIVLDSRE